MYYVVKRMMDIVFSGIIMILLSPIFFTLVILLKFTGEGEIFYKQERVGKDGQTFGILKFATMLKDSLNLGNKSITTQNDPRITPVGKYLRASKINELPQLWNVFIGDMSFVGPRPLLLPSFRKYSMEVQNSIVKMKPGITGIGSVIFRDEERLLSEVIKLGGDTLSYYQNHIYPYKGEMETYYFNNRTFKMDCELLMLTAWKIFFKDSDLEYLFFKDISVKPRSLTLEGIREIYIESIKHDHK